MSQPSTGNAGCGGLLVLFFLIGFVLTLGIRAALFLTGS